MPDINKFFTNLLDKATMYFFIPLFAYLLLFCGPSFAQTPQISRNSDGLTTAGLAPGAPAGAYPLSEFENTNLFNGQVSFTLPIVQKGRGGANISLPIKINRPSWLAQHRLQEHPNPNPVGQTFDHVLEPYPDWWNDTYTHPILPGGRMYGRYVNTQITDCTAVGNGMIYQRTNTFLTFIAPDGTEYKFIDKLQGGKPRNNNGCSVTGDNSRGTIWVSDDGSAATFISQSFLSDQTSPDDPYRSETFLVYGYVMLKDGTRFDIVDGKVTRMRDRNGNEVKFEELLQSGPSGPYAVGYKITDSLNREIRIDYNATGDPQYGQHDKITIKGFGGAERIIRVSYTFEGNWLRTTQPSDPTSPWPLQDLFPHLDGYGPAGGMLKVASIWLPDGRRYQFRYNVYQELARVELPTGGAIEYDYEGGELGGTITGEVGEYDIPRYPANVLHVPRLGIYRRLVTRRLYKENNTLEGKTTYSKPNNTYTVSEGWESDLVVEQWDSSGTICLNRSRHYFHGSARESAMGNFDPVGVPSWSDGREKKTEALSLTANPIPLRSVESSWSVGLIQSISDPLYYIQANPRITETKATLNDSNQVSKQTFIYSNDIYNNQTDVYEYDYGSGQPGALIRRGHIEYLTVHPLNGADYAASNSIHIRNSPTRQQLFDAGGVLRAETTYEYDNYNWDGIGMTARPGITGLEAGYGTSYVFRGNVTKVSRWSLANTGLELPLNTDRAISSFSQYDIAGNVVKVRDPNTNETTFDYSDSFSGSFTPNTFAFLKSTTSPNPGGAYGGNQPLVSTSTYDFSSGKVVSTTDPNGKMTSFEYADSLDRLTRVIRPSGGGETVYQYGDAIGNLFLQTQTKQDASTWLEDYVAFDGLGRAKRSAHKESASSWSVRESQYDALGRVSQVSNPFFASSHSAGAGSAWTTTTYDVLSRVTQVATPDNALVKTTYLGNQVTVEDQAGKKRSSITDGLGRLIQVNEAPNDSAYNYQTNYTYDVLGNLIRVRQGGFPTSGSGDPTVQFRRFYYDSLSRLVYANNPEQNATIAFNPPGESGTMWTMAYAYDNNGNLTGRTDARNVTTTYAYDALNRNTTVNYSDTPTISPDIKRFYDTATNGKGRLQRIENYVVNPQNSLRADSRTIIGGYDNLGRVTSQTQGFWKPATSNWQDFATSRTYDLASHATFQANPSGSYANYQFNTGGRLLQSWGTLGADSVETFYSSGTQYNAAGQLTQELLGSSVYHRMDYNSRFQMIETRVSSNPIDSTSWDLGKLRFFYNLNAKNNENPALDGMDNNGNVLRQEHWVPTSVSNVVQGGNTVKVVNQYAVPMRDDYLYDPINRITQVQGWQRTSGTATPAQIYQQTYSYDKFGNRKLVAAPQTWGNLINGTQATDIYDINKLTNQLAGGFYDRAGNLRVDSGLSLKTNDRTYDAENRMTVAKVANVNSYYVYDGDGRRVRRIVNGAENWQVYGIDGELLAEYQWNGTTVSLKKEYGYRDGQLLVVAEPAVGQTPPQVKWLIADHLGTPRMVVDKTGSLSGMTRHDYLPFGEELAVGMGNSSIRNTGLGYSGDSVRQKFTRYERDAETDLDFAQSRFYSKLQGRFTSADYFGGSRFSPQTLNLYSYVQNNPLRFVDPTGHFSEPSDKDKRKQEKVEKTDYVLQVDTKEPLAKPDAKPSLINRIFGSFGRFFGRAARWTQRPGISIVIDTVKEEVRNPSTTTYAPDILRPPNLPSGSDIEQSFEEGNYDAYYTVKAEVLFRVFSDPEWMMGPDHGTYFTPVEYTNSAQAIRELALDQDVKYPNKAAYIVMVVVPTGTPVYRGKVAGIKGKEDIYPGGGTQYYIPGIKSVTGVSWGYTRSVIYKTTNR